MILPYELFEVIAYDNPTAFKLMFSTCKKLAQMDQLIAMNKFIISCVGSDRIGWRLPNGIMHRINGPAMIYSDGTEKWYNYGYLHRTDGPAVCYANGTKKWYIDGKLHREGKPAIERSNGTKEWYINGKQHREDGPAMEVANVIKRWYKNGNLHRTNGPAIINIRIGVCEWYRDGKLLHHDTDPESVMREWQS